MSISVITPTLKRPQEVHELLENLAAQTLLPVEAIIVDGAPLDDQRTESVIRNIGEMPFKLIYLRHTAGIARQRNAGIECATGAYLAFVDDDIRLQLDFFEILLDVLVRYPEAGGVVGYKQNKYTDPATVGQMRFYRTFRLLSTYEPGSYDRRNGRPINLNFQPPFSGVRKCDFINFACSLWRSEAFETGYRFDPHFEGYGVMEDVHLSLKIGQEWTLLHCGDALADELSSPHSREHQFELGRKRIVNLHYIFRDIVQPFTYRERYRFWKFFLIDILRLILLELGFFIKNRRVRRKRVQLIKGYLGGALQLWLQVKPLREYAYRAAGWSR